MEKSENEENPEQEVPPFMVHLWNLLRILIGLNAMIFIMKRFNPTFFEETILTGITNAEFIALIVGGTCLAFALEHLGAIILLPFELLYEKYFQR